MPRPSLIILLFIMLLSQLAFTQKIEDGYFSVEEDSLKILLNRIQISETDSDRLYYNSLFTELLHDVLFDELSFKYPFDSLKWIGKLTSPDKVFRLYNWNLEMDDGTYRYFGFLQFIHSKKKTVKLYELIDQSDSIEDPEKASLKADNWYGALYYKILKHKHSGRVFYTLFGWDGIDNFTTGKIIDVVRIGRNGKPYFGYNLFKINKKSKKRVIFKYANQARMMLRYDEKQKMIVFDHLSPSQEIYKGNYQYYGPDLSYDGLEFRKGKWYLVEDLDLRRKEGKTRRWEYRPSESIYNKIAPGN